MSEDALAQGSTRLDFLQAESQFRNNGLKGLRSGPEAILGQCQSLLKDKPILGRQYAQGIGGCLFL
jgi:hypothetical protein